MYNPLKYLWRHFLAILYDRITSRMEIEKKIKKKEKRLEILRSFKHIGHSANIIYDDYSITGAKYISIGDDFLILHHFRLEAIDSYSNKHFNPQIIIGNNFSAQDFCHIGCIEKIEIGDNVMIASKVFITDHFHGKINKEDINIAPTNRILTSKPIKIGNNVWIGDSVCIMPGVTLGNNIIVGANAVVTHNFPDNTVIAGCPAKIIKHLE